MRILLLLAILLLAACATKPEARQPAPVPEIVEVPVAHYVPVDKKLTARCAWRKNAPLEVMPSVARERKKCLEQYELQFDGIDAIQGKPVPKQ